MAIGSGGQQGLHSAFRGMIDEVIFSKGAWDDDQIEDHHSVGKVRKKD